MSYSKKLINSIFQTSKKDSITAASMIGACDNFTNVQDGAQFNIIGAFVFHIHNDKCENPEYDTMVLMFPDGNGIQTNSESAINSMEEIVDLVSDVAEAPVEKITIEVKKRDSQNNSGKYVKLVYVDHTEKDGESE